MNTKYYIKYFLILITLVIISTNDAYSQIAYKHGNLYQNNEKLTKVQAQQILTTEQYKDYVSGKRLYQSGVVLTSVGGCIAGISTVKLIRLAVLDHKHPIESPPGLSPVPLNGIISAGGLILGGTILAAGIPCLCVGVGRLKATASNGIGVTCHF